MHVQAIQYDIRWEDKPASQARMDQLLAASPPSPGSLLLTPELGDVGFSRNLDAIIDEASMAWATATATRYGCWVQHGWAQRTPDEQRGVNTAAIINPDGNLVGRYDKICLFSPGREHEAYEPGNAIHLFDIDGSIVCPLICYDLRFPELWRLATIAGAEIFTIGASWPAARTGHWQALALARAIENQAWVIAVNRTGEDPSMAYAGGSLIASPTGEIVATGDDREQVMSAEIDPQAARNWRARFPCQDDVNPAMLGAIDIIRH